MTPPLLPTDEALRLDALHQYAVLDTPREQALDDLTALAAHICGAPISLISLVDEHRQWFKSKVGFSRDEMPRDISFCGHAILQSDLFIVPDATRDERFADNPLVREDPHVRFYAGVPLVTPKGQTLGTLCVLDRVPRQLDQPQLDALRMLSRQVMSQLELRRQARELAESEERLRLVTENSRVGLVIVNRQRCYLYANKAYAEILELSSSAIVGQRVADVLPALYENQISPRLDRAFAGEQVAYELQKPGPDRVCYYTVRYEPTVIGGEVKFVVVVITEITERKEAEVVSRRLAAIVESSDDAIIGKDMNGIITTWNRGAQKIFGYSAVEVVGTSVLRLIPAERHSEEQHILAKIRDGQSVGHFETVRQTKDGRQIDVSITVSPIKDADGKVIGVSKVARNITERKRAESRFRRLVDSNVQGVMFADNHGEISGANDAFLKMIGYTREDLEANRLNWVALTPPAYVGLDQRAVAEMKTKGTCTPYEKEYIRKDGSRVPVLIGAAAFEEGREGEGVCFVIDLTERKKLERQFLRAQRMESVGTLASGIAHDLNNVLAPILMAIEILKTCVHDEPGPTMLDTMHASALRGADLVKQVLSFARGVDGQRVTVNPVRLMQELLKVMRDTFPKSIGVDFNPARDLWTVTGDATQVHQVFLNLCVNARDAMPDGGTLTVCMENVVLDETYAGMNVDSRPGAYVMIKVEDTGIGIPPVIRDKIFEPFFTTKEVGKGTGLGLSTALAIVKSHGGFINVYSEVGKGTKFKIYLPANTTEAAADRVAVEKTELPRGNGELVLVVDDEAAIRKIVNGTLVRFGYHVLLANNGAEAVALYVQHRSKIAVVLTDMAMPVMDGMATIIALKALNPEVKIIASSGLEANGGVAKALGIGVRHFVPKPYTAETMLRLLDEVLHPK